MVQAVGAAMLQANSVAIIYLAMPKERLGRAIGIQGAAQALGLALGPTIGGLLLAAGGWRLIFFVNVPGRDRRHRGRRGSSCRAAATYRPAPL